jgi:hypothetical protein
MSPERASVIAMQQLVEESRQRRAALRAAAGRPECRTGTADPQSDANGTTSITI